MSIVLRSSLLIIAAFAAWGLWFGEVCWVKGWAGLAWLDGFNWSSLPICAVIVVTSSYCVSPDAGWGKRIKFVLFGFMLTTDAFVAGRWAMMEPWIVWYSYPPEPIYKPLVVLVAAALTVSVGLTAAASRWLAPLHIWTMVAVVISLALVLPLSFATITVFPPLNGATNEIHAIKMGYPVLWTVFLVPLALRLGRKRRGLPAAS